MENYCTVAIFVWLGIPLFLRGLIILESDAFPNVTNRGEISPVFQKRDDYGEYPSANPLNTGNHDSKRRNFLNTNEKTNNQDVKIVTPAFENHDDSHDHSFSVTVSAGGPESTKLSSSNIDEKYNKKVSLDFTKQDYYRDQSSLSTISDSIQESTKNLHLNIDENSRNKKDETTLSAIEISNNSLHHSLENLIDGGSYEMVESDPVLEETPEDIELVYQMNKRRHVPDRGFAEKTKKLMLDLHNVYRGNVTPPAGDMNFLEWDDNLEHLAQLWADNCNFNHGRPPNTNYKFEGKISPYGQNLYLGTDPSGYKSLWMWYEEYMFYDLRNQTCKPNEQCGHYVQMAWAESKRLGCGIKLCGMRYLIVCHYYPGALKGVQMFHVGRPCSQCNEEEGALCKNKLCVSHELCKRKPKFCESAKCNLKCQNCGRLNKTSCQCTCADGWDSPDCSKLCSDEHERCGRKPGFPHKASCSIQNYSVAKKYCRKMCGTCAAVTNDTTINHLCCEGSLCKKGYVLDLERKPCRCTLLCPGPLCDVLEDMSPTLKYSLIIMMSQILVLYFMNDTYYSL